jgi:hypothetical protein
LSRVPPTIHTLERAPDRVFSLLMGLSELPLLRRTLETSGLTPAERAEGWRLLQRLGESTSGPVLPPRDEVVGEARVRLDRESRHYARRVEAAVTRLAPSRLDAIFGRIHFDEHVVLWLPRLLDALDALARDPAASPLVAALERRRLGADVRATLRELVDTAKGMRRDPLPDAPPPDVPPPDDRAAILLELHTWWQEWSAAVRAADPSRLDLIRLGLAKLRRSS